MRLLLYTHVLIWLMEANPKLSDHLVGTLRDMENELLVSIGSVWEIAIKCGIGKMRLKTSYERFLETAIKDYGINLLPVTELDCLECYKLPFFKSNHKDPFDRMIISQAIRNSLTVVSADEAFDADPVRRIW